jgi:hypothetical protein
MSQQLGWRHMRNFKVALVKEKVSNSLQLFDWRSISTNKKRASKIPWVAEKLYRFLVR